MSNSQRWPLPMSEIKAFWSVLHSKTSREKIDIKSLLLMTIVFQICRQIVPLQLRYWWAEAVGHLGLCWESFGLRISILTYAPSRTNRTDSKELNWSSNKNNKLSKHYLISIGTLFQNGWHQNLYHIRLQLLMLRERTIESEIWVFSLPHKNKKICLFTRKFFLTRIFSFCSKRNVHKTLCGLSVHA